MEVRRLSNKCFRRFKQLQDDLQAAGEFRHGGSFSRRRDGLGKNERPEASGGSLRIRTRIFVTRKKEPKRDR